MITQEDCISAHQAEKKRKIPTGPSSAKPPRYRLVQNTSPRAPPQNNQSGRWVAKPPQQSRFNRPPVPQPQQQQQQPGSMPNFPQFNQGNNNNCCLNCGSSSHFIKNCPQPRKSFQGQTSNPSSKGQSKKQTVQVRQGSVNFTTLFELPEGVPIMTGTFTIHYQPAVILFDFGATHNFISPKFGTKVGLDYYHIKGTYMIATRGGKIASNQICRDVPIQLGSNLIKIDLILLNLEGMDILLGMDWMTRHQVSLDISSRAVEIDSPDHGTTILYLPQREYVNSCVYAIEGIELKDIPVVCEYPDVFLDDLPGMPPDRDIEFIIELQPDTAPISKRPYRMPPNELAELKVQPQDLLDKCFIRPSASP
jgi:hypothetical protein